MVLVWKSQGFRVGSFHSLRFSIFVIPICSEKQSIEKKKRRIDVKYSEVGKDYGSSSWRARAKTKAGMLFPSFFSSSGLFIHDTWSLLQSWLNYLYLLPSSEGKFWIAEALFPLKKKFRWVRVLGHRPLRLFVPVSVSLQFIIRGFNFYAINFHGH